MRLYGLERQLNLSEQSQEQTVSMTKRRRVDLAGTKLRIEFSVPASKLIAKTGI